MYYLILLLAICVIFVCGFILGKCYASFYWSIRLDRKEKEKQALNEQIEKLMEDVRKGKYSKDGKRVH